MISRKQVIEQLTADLEPLEFLYTFWLEGADATNQVDSYSDLDFWLDFEDSHEGEAMEAVEASLAKLSELDLNHAVEHSHPKIRQRVYHLAGTSEYLLIDFCYQFHSREDFKDYTFYRKDKVENAKILFDKAGIIHYSEIPKRMKRADRERYLAECDYLFSQLCRVKKYLQREEYSECLAHYYKYVVDPVVTLLRLTYTPGYPEYSLAHISRQIPDSERRRLERLLKISALSDLERNIKEAEGWYYRLRQELEAAANAGKRY